MALSTKCARTSLTQSARPRSAPRRMVVVRAGFGDIFRDFMKIFSPPSDNNRPLTGSSTSFGAKIKHHDGGRPFADGYVSGGQRYSKASAEPLAAEEQPEQGEDYLGGALERVIGHNFTGDTTEPKVGTGAAGWKGDIHPRGKDGFHAKKF